MWREGRNVALVSAKLITSIFAFSTNFRNSEWSLSSAGESTNTMILLVNKTNRCTEFQFYWYYDSTCFGQPFCPSSGVLGRTSALVHFMQL